MKITVDTKVGELIPEGNDCWHCPFLDAQGNSCNLLLENLPCKETFYKSKSCPKPPVEETK